MQVIKDVFVPMRDGVELAVDIYRPEAPGRYPALLQRTPYLKSGIVTGRLGADGLMAGNPVGITVLTPIAASAKALADEGYVAIVSEPRGPVLSRGGCRGRSRRARPWPAASVPLAVLPCGVTPGLSTMPGTTSPKLASSARVMATTTRSSFYPVMRIERDRRRTTHR